jgi:2'-5' RNA ligase
VSQALFAGWTPDAPGREHLSRLLSEIRAAARPDAPRIEPRRPDQWHITLCFIGHALGDAVAATAARALVSVAGRVPPHAFRVERVAYWPGPGVIVALPEHNPTLQALCDDCAVSLRRAGIGPLAPIRQTSQPHITLAYAGKRLPPQPWLDEVECPRAAFRVDRFELLYNPGGRYASLAQWPLTGADLPPQPQQVPLL